MKITSCEHVDLLCRFVRVLKRNVFPGMPLVLTRDILHVLTLYMLNSIHVQCSHISCSNWKWYTQYIYTLDYVHSILTVHSLTFGLWSRDESSTTENAYTEGPIEFVQTYFCFNQMSETCIIFQFFLIFNYDPDK